MRIAILSAGLSLRRTYRPDVPYDVRIAVNAAAGEFACDYWSCGDGLAFAQTVPVGFPAVFTIDRDDGHFRRVADRLAKHRVMLWCDKRPELMEMGCPATWSDWSITAALALAVLLRDATEQTQIDVYGHDLSGTVDVGGFEIASRPSYFPRVAAAWDDVLAWARKIPKVKVNRIEA